MVKRLRLLREDPWLQDFAGNRIDVPSDSPQSFAEDTREAMHATLDGQAWYLVLPANTPNGPQYFLRCNVPGRPQDIVYADTPISVLKRAQDMGFLVFGEKAPAPAVPKPVAQAPTMGRRRPGDLR